METKLENYKKSLAQRQIWVSCGLIVVSIFLLCMGYLFRDAACGHIPDFIRGFQTGLFLGLELLLVFYVVQLIAAQKDEAKLRKFYIAEHDERSASIRLHTFAASSVFSLVLLTVATITAGFFDEKICMTLLVTLIAQLFVKLPFKLYYAKKF